MSLTALRNPFPSLRLQLISHVSMGFPEDMCAPMSLTLSSLSSSGPG